MINFKYLLRPGKFPHKIILTDDLSYAKRKEILKWLKDFCGDYNTDYVHWGMKRSRVFNCDNYEIFFKDKGSIMAFKIRWT